MCALEVGCLFGRWPGEDLLYRRPLLDTLSNDWNRRTGVTMGLG